MNVFTNSDSIQTAKIHFNNLTYYSCYSPTINEPHSAVTQLIQGIYTNYPFQAQEILRNRIYLNYQPTLMCHSMIKIAAKRFAIDKNFKIAKDHIPIQYFPYEQTLKTTPKASIETAIQWLKAKDLETPLPRYLSHRNVKAFITNYDKTIFMFAKNENQSNKTLHAEVILLQKYFQSFKRGFTEPTELYTTLQCCKMCASMFWQMHQHPLDNLKVFYLQKEHGPSAVNTILQGNSNIRRETYREQKSFWSRQLEHQIL